MRNRFIRVVTYSLLGVAAVLCFSLDINAKGNVRVTGKKSDKGLMKSIIEGDTAGDTFGFEVHSKGKEQRLTGWGFYSLPEPDGMNSMKFSVEVYDMGGAKVKEPARFISVSESPLIFDYDGQAVDGKMTYRLSEPLKLPEHALVVVKMLDNLGDRKLWFKSNLTAKSTWTLCEKTGEWIKQPFATPFFIEYEKITEQQK
ncbi:MAG: hypothetical protein K2M79_06380 [Muribaculaceae bacterium]|nr:hypothetical protein [Muribaculaceae bacterium]